MSSHEKEQSREIKNPLWDFAVIGALASAAFFGFEGLKHIFKRH